MTAELTAAPIISPINWSNGRTFILKPDLKSFSISPASPHATATMQAIKNNVRSVMFVEKTVPSIFNPFRRLFKKEITSIEITAYISIGFIPVFPVEYPAIAAHKMHIIITIIDKNGEIL